ncbi:MAG: DUF2911 domain-containing protein [Chitinophagaceae bacterium]|nr:DUF2911 domain-containing protein [Chitinophagaceae bacterium]
MNKSIFITGVLFMSAVVSMAQEVKKVEEISYNPNAKGDTSKRSIKSAVVGKIGDANITINYNSPGVRKRTIWGGLVPYKDVWVTGAHNATTLEVDKSFIVAGKVIPKGKYAIFTIPRKAKWTVIINKNWNQHLTDDYLQKEDVVRIKVKPVKQVKLTERLQYYIKNATGNKGTIVMAWEKIEIEFEVIIKD